LVLGNLRPGIPKFHHPLDTPSWRVNLTQQSSGCDEVRRWCGPCCRRQAAHAGVGINELRRKLAQPHATLHVSVVGNSVARFHNFGVARGVVHELERRYPSAKISIEYAHVAGGFEPDHLYYCGLGSRNLLRADLILLHYHAPRGGLVYEKVLRRLLMLPRRPVVVYIAHCTMSDFSAHRDWAVARDRGAWGWRMADEAQGYFEELRSIEQRMVREHYGLSFASTCAAFHTMLGGVDQSDRLVDTSFEPTVRGWLTRMARRYLPYGLARGLDTPRTDELGTWPSASTCDDGARLSHVTDLQSRFFPAGDHLHLSPNGSALQACLTAHALLDAPQSREHVHSPHVGSRLERRAQRAVAVARPPAVAAAAVAVLPPPLLGRREAAVFCGTGGGRGGYCTDESSDEPAFCLSAKGDDSLPRAVPPWVAGIDRWAWIRSGGADHTKAFMHTGSEGAFLRISTLQPARAFFLQIYQHHERGLGLLSVSTAGMTDPPQLIDPCCAHPGCPGKPIGKGGYAMVRVPATGFLPLHTKEINITVIARGRRGEASRRCAQKGSDASVAGVVGLVPPEEVAKSPGMMLGVQGAGEAAGPQERSRARKLALRKLARI